MGPSFSILELLFTYFEQDGFTPEKAILALSA